MWGRVWCARPIRGADSLKRFGVSCLLLLLLWGDGSLLLGRNRAAAREAYRRALQYHRNLLEVPLRQRTEAQYDRSIFLFRRVIDHDPTYGACDDALFAIGSLYEEKFERFQRDRSRRRAIYHFEFLVDQYPLTKHRKAARTNAKNLRDWSARKPKRRSASAAARRTASANRLATLNEIRYWSNEEYTRVVIQLDQEVEFARDNLANPDRIYFDLQNTRLQTNLERAYEVNGVALSRIRVAENSPGTIRVVLDFKNVNKNSVFALYDPFRIVIDTRGGPQSAAASQVAAPAQTIKTAEAVISLDSARKREVLTEKPLIPSPNRGGKLSLTRVLGLKVGRVAIDPGHGGRDHGSTGPGGLREKDLVLSIALKLRDLLRKRLETEVIMTRDRDVFVPLEERTAIANKEGADLLISIHANASRYRKVSGVETFFLSFTSGAEERAVASRENAGSQRTIRELEDLVKKITLGDYSNESRDLAHIVQDSLYRQMRELKPNWRNRGVKKAPFIVLLNATMPAILTEIGFISNPQDESLLKKEQAQAGVAEALYSAIETYFRSLGATHAVSSPAQ